MRIAMILGLLALSSPVMAEPMGADAFDTFTRGKTFYFSVGETPYGAERYLSGRRVEWTFLDGKCKRGEWYPQGDDICFVYEDNMQPQCWQFEVRGSGMSARFVGAETETTLYSAAPDDKPMTCLGPEVGV